MLRAALIPGGGRLASLLPRRRALSGSSSIASDPAPPADPTGAIQAVGVDLPHPDTVPALLVDPELALNHPAASRFFSSAAALNSRSFNSML
jgi:hypothetical protein